MLHYLNDYIMLGVPESGEWQEALDYCATDMWPARCVPIIMYKTEGPNTTIIFLASRLKPARLPKAKLRQLKEEIRKWSGHSRGLKKQLQSLIGKLQHACCVVKSGRSFLRRMLDLMVAIKKSHLEQRLDKGLSQI